MIDKEVQARLERILQGKEPRDREWEDQQAAEGHKREEALARAKYEHEHPPVRSHRELELEQREFNLRTFGRTAMERYARPLDGVDELAVPGDAPLVRMKGHSASPAPCRGPDGKLLLQNHGACPIKQKLELRRG
jgi:hypothetical protein